MVAGVAVHPKHEQNTGAQQWTRSAWGLTIQCCERLLTEFVSGLPSFDFEPERFECENNDIIFRDGFGRKVMYSAALED